MSEDLGLNRTSKHALLFLPRYNPDTALWIDKSSMMREYPSPGSFCHSLEDVGYEDDSIGSKTSAKEGEKGKTNIIGHLGVFLNSVSIIFVIHRLELYYFNSTSALIVDNLPI